MDNMSSYKRYATNLVIANVIIPIVWILLSVSLIKTLDENNKMFIMSSMAVIAALNIMSAYFGITGIVRHFTCEVTTFYVLTKLAILCETFLYLLIVFTDNRFSTEHPITSTIHTGVTIVLVITQIWLMYESRNFFKLGKVFDDKSFDDFRARGLSAPPNISDLDKNPGLYTLTDQLLDNPMAASTSKCVNSHNNLYYNHLGPKSQIGGQPPVYQPLSQPLWDEKPQSFYNPWNYPSQTGLSYKWLGKDFPN